MSAENKNVLPITSPMLLNHLIHAHYLVSPFHIVSLLCCALSGALSIGSSHYCKKMKNIFRIDYTSVAYPFHALFSRKGLNPIEVAYILGRVDHRF